MFVANPSKNRCNSGGPKRHILLRVQAFWAAAQALNGSEVTSGQQLWNDLSENLVDTPFEVRDCY
jgi:hypothetical protein